MARASFSGVAPAAVSVSSRPAIRSRGAGVAGRLATARRSSCPVPRHSQECRATLDSSTTLAVTQQLVALGVFVGGEAGVSYSTMKPGAPGRPNLIIAGAGIVSLVAASQLVGSTGTPSAGLMAGTAACGALMAWSAKRFADTVHDPSEWPGPKAWPAASVLASLFGLVLCVESLAS